MVVKLGQTGTLDQSSQGRASNLPSLTPEERKALSEKARVVKAANVAARKASTLRSDFTDAAYWDDLARERKLRLPPWGKAATVGNFRSYLRKLGLTQADYETEIGCTLSRYIAINGEWPLRALCGVAIEFLAEKEAEPMEQVAAMK